jgi:thiol-disulfide isomerase/thioredoxin
MKRVLLVFIWMTAASTSVRADGVAPVAGAVAATVDPKPWTQVSAATFSSWLGKSAGKITVVNFWASYCLPCLEELPLMQQMQKDIGDRVAFRFISVDGPDDESHVKTLLRRRKIVLESSITADAPAPWTQLLKPWDGTVPMTVVFGADGKEVARIEGQVDGPSLRAVLTPLLAPPKGSL